MEVGEGNIPSPVTEKVRVRMFTVSDILQDIQRGIAAHNMVETEFSYRLVYFINFENGSEKHYADTRYNGLRVALENIIRGNLTTTNTVVISAVTTLKDRKCVSLLSRSYPFSLREYFQKICEAKEKDNISNNYGRRRANWC